MSNNKKKFKLNFSKYCESCDNKIWWFQRLDFTLVDPVTNRIIRKDKIHSSEELEERELIINLFHKKCLKKLVVEAEQRLTEIMKQRKNIRDEDLR